MLAKALILVILKLFQRSSVGIASEKAMAIQAALLTALAAWAWLMMATRPTLWLADLYDQLRAFHSPDQQALLSLLTCITSVALRV
jgi:hypothetical protein